MPDRNAENRYSGWQPFLSCVLCEQTTGEQVPFCLLPPLCPRIMYMMSHCGIVCSPLSRNGTMCVYCILCIVYIFCEQGEMTHFGGLHVVPAETSRGLPFVYMTHLFSSRFRNGFDSISQFSYSKYSLKA